MTKTKALKIIQTLIANYGKDYVLFNICDEYLFKFVTTKNDIENGGVRYYRDEKQFIRGAYTLESLLTDIENCKSLSDYSSLPIEQIKTIAQYVRQCDNRIDFFKGQSPVSVTFEDSKRKYEKFTDDNAEAIKKYNAKVKKQFYGLATIASALNSISNF